MPQARLEEWRSSVGAGDRPLPEQVEGEEQDALELVVEDVAVGGVVVGYHHEGGRRRARVLRLQSTLAHDAAADWAALLTALERHLRDRGALSVVTAVPPSLAGVFRAAGYLATMTTVSKSYEGQELELQDDQRVAVRPMDADERRQYAVDAVALALAGMERAGVTGSEAALGDLGERIAGLAADPPPEGELLLVGVLDGVPIGRLWATLVTTEDGALDFHGNLVDLFPEYRGRRLTPSFLGALRRELHALDVRGVTGRLYAHDASARRRVVTEGAGIDEVHLRKDLG